MTSAVAAATDNGRDVQRVGRPSDISSKGAADRSGAVSGSSHDRGSGHQTWQQTQAQAAAIDFSVKRGAETFRV